ncbi:MAG: sigma 54-interacting transcriptional regulator [Fibrobacterales bacterium]
MNNSISPPTHDKLCDVNPTYSQHDEINYLKSTLNSVLSRMDSIYVEIDENYQVKYANPSSLKMTGYTEQDLEEGLHFVSLFPTWEHERLQQAMTKVLCNDYGKTMEWQLKARNGEIKVIEARAYPTRDALNNLTGVQLFGHEVTRLRMVEAQFQAGETRFIHSFTKSPIPKVLYNENGLIINQNQECIELFSNSSRGSISNFLDHLSLSNNEQTTLNNDIPLNCTRTITTNSGETVILNWKVSRVLAQSETSANTYMAQAVITPPSQDTNDIQEEGVLPLAPSFLPKEESYIFKSPKMVTLTNRIQEVANTDAPVLLRGESGTGKEVMATLIKNCSLKKDAPFISINCGSIPESLIESELFGFKKGAFTDAKADKKGKVALAQGGTLFLDEVGDMPLSMQVKFLRLLEQKKYYALGSEIEEHADVRIVAATHQPLEELVAQKSFRKDLYYRLNVITLNIPPLRERLEDIPPLCFNFLNKANRKNRKAISDFSSEVMHFFLTYNFPGNIRELENIINHLVVFARNSIIHYSDLPDYLQNQSTLVTSNSPSGSNEISTNQKNDDENDTRSEKERIFETLKTAEGNKSLAANMLGIHRSTLIRKLKRLTGE